MINTLVLDFDGTLVDSNRIKRQGFLNFASSDVGGEVIMSRILKEVSGDRTSVLSAYLQERDGRTLRDNELSNALDSYSDKVDEAIVGAPEMLGASEFLSTMRAAGFKLVLSSATPEKNLLDIVSRRGWLDRFELVSGSPLEKIDTLKSLVSSETRPAQLAVIGDGQDDKNSAEQIGCHFFPVGEARGINSNERIYTLPEICNLLSSEMKMRVCAHA
jgi:phosphoglycolate phosphatase-like HAD superfamily hydrolase